MTRITQNLFESIQKVTAGEVAEASVDKAHFCATHVEHSLLGHGECISEQHAEPDEEGNIAWYTVKFPIGTHRVETSQLRVVEGKSHAHSKKMAEELQGNQHKIDANKNGKIDAHDFKLLRSKKNEVKKEEVEIEEEVKDEYARKVDKHLKKKYNKEEVNKDTSAFDWKSKAKNSESSFEKKKVSTGTVYTKKPSKEKEEMKEGVSQTVINHQDFVLEITDNPTFADYFNAMQAIVPSMDENIQKEMITIATEAYNEGYVDVILESMAREAFSGTLNNYRKEGFAVLDEHYIVESNEPYVEYTLEKEGSMIKYVHVGAVVHSK
jgi:hypothetical protein